MKDIAGRLALMFFFGMIFGHLVTNYVASQWPNHDADLAYGCGMLMGEHVMRPSELGTSDYELSWCAAYRNHRDAWAKDMKAKADERYPEEKP